MDVQAFYKALATVLSEKTQTQIKVKEIKQDGRHESINESRTAGNGDH